jgi:Tfp pilus assembly protein PilN
LPVKEPELRSLLTVETKDAQHAMPAIAVAMAAMESPATQVDFLHSRLAPPREQTNRRKLIRAGSIAGVIVLAAAGAYIELRTQAAKLASEQAQLDSLEPEIKKAQVEADRLKFANIWIPDRPRFIACLAELTKAFPDEGSVYATAVSVRTDLTGQVAGKASSEQSVLALLDKLRDDKRFVDPKLMDMRDSGPGGREVSFTIAFAYRPVE